MAYENKNKMATFYVYISVQGVLLKFKDHFIMLPYTLNEVSLNDVQFKQITNINTYF